MDHTTPPPQDSHTSPVPPSAPTTPPTPPPTEPPKLEVAPPNAKPETPNTEHQTPAPRKLVRRSSPVRVLLLVMAVFVGLFLLIRTLAVEPFGVPTGSMAPALIGHHRAAECPRCGYTVRVGRPATGATEHYANAVCQNCEHHFSLANARDLSGDRLMVDKNVYSLRAPRRWEMVVFRCPDPDPKEFGKPYVKRLIGLPGETITIVDGDVYVNGNLARKGLAEVRETAFPVFDMNYPPKGQGWGVRWLVGTEGDPRPPAAGSDTKVAAEAPLVEGKALVLDASESAQAVVGVTYRHWHLDERREEPVRVWNAYDGAPRRFGQFPAAHDFILTCEVEVTAVAEGDASFACRLMDGADAVTAEIAVGAKSDGQARLTREGRGELGTAPGVTLRPGKKYTLEFAFVDRQALLALDGKLVVPPGELEPAAVRTEVRRPLQLGARGCRVVVRDLKLSRDIHYTHYGEHGTRHPAVLGPGEYYVLGDNSGNSQDSRKWPSPAVPEGDFIGKPVLIHQPLRLSRVTVGGREREVQTLDWSRVRWLH